jgi:16S rRNA (guanine966-N2)-methyltransferase
VAGDLRGRRIESPVGDATRPTTDKVREAVFNALGSLDLVDGARVLDLFAGTGAMGIEALSRGAAHCTFVESDRKALEVLRTNLRVLGLEQRSTVVSGDATSSMVSAHAASLVIADPPYGFDAWPAVVRNLSPGAFVVIESGSPIVVPDGWESQREKRYGRSVVTFLTRREQEEGTVEPS